MSFFVALGIGASQRKILAQHGNANSKSVPQLCSLQERERNQDPEMFQELEQHKDFPSSQRLWSHRPRGKEGKKEIFLALHASIHG